MCSSSLDIRELLYFWFGLTLLKIELNRKNWVLSKTTHGIDCFPASFTMEHIYVCVTHYWNSDLKCKCLLLEKNEGLFLWWWNNNNNNNDKTNDCKVIRFWSSVCLELPKILGHMKENIFYAWMYLQNCFGPFHVLCIHLKSSMWSHVKKHPVINTTMIYSKDKGYMKNCSWQNGR